MPFSPLTLTLSPKGRGNITFNNTKSNKRRKDMRRVQQGGKLLFFLFILFLLVGCSYDAASVQRSPRGGVDCTKFATEYTQEERRICSGN